MPDFDLKIQWKQRSDLRARKELHFGNNKAGLPSLQQSVTTLSALVR